MGRPDAREIVSVREIPSADGSRKTTISIVEHGAVKKWRAIRIAAHRRAPDGTWSRVIFFDVLPSQMDEVMLGLERAFEQLGGSA